MNFKELREMIQRYMNLGDECVKAGNYIDAIQYYSVAIGLLYSLDRVGYVDKYVAGMNFILKQKLDTAKDFFQEAFDMAVSNL